MNNAALIVFMYDILFMYVGTSFGCVARSKSARSYGMPMFDFCR